MVKKPGFFAARQLGIINTTGYTMMPSSVNTNKQPVAETSIILIWSEKSMAKDFGESTPGSRQDFNPPTPQPGEIWEVSRWVRSPLKFSKEEQQQLYSEAARRFLEAKSPPRYVTIVSEPDPPLDSEAEWQVVSVMVMSGVTNFLSDVDLLIPQAISGVGQD
ncbi:MAG TPA: hypothetical protein DCE56_08565, partial [Cyanobacteria bacterium UBA8553]|nr:hypothetical protein [Cyanobacteria bacterium UBA8553]